MSKRLVSQVSFSYGEVDAVNFNRTELGEYLQAARSLKNMTIGLTQLTRKRAGTTQVFNITNYANTAIKMFKLQDKDNNFYVIFMVPMAAHVFKLGNNTLTFVSSLTVPYEADYIQSLQSASAIESLFTVSEKYAPSRVYIKSYSPTPTFAFENLNFSVKPSFDFRKINYGDFDVDYTVAGSTLTFKFTQLSADPGFDSSWVGGVIIGDGNSVDEPIGYAIIESVTIWSGNPSDVTFHCNIRVAFKSSGFETKGQYYSVRQPVFSDALGYPNSVLFYQRRLWFGGTPSLPDCIMGSETDKPVGFDVGVGNPTDAIVDIIGDAEAGKLIGLNGGKQLEIFAENGEYVAPQDAQEALTPDNFEIRKESSKGSSGNCRPITYGNNTYFIGKGGSAIYLYEYEGLGQDYNTENVSYQAEHLVKNPIERALQRSQENDQDNLVYYLNPDNTISAFVFTDSTGNHALSPIEFQDDVEIKDILEIDNTIYLLKFYNKTNQYYFEKFDNAIRMDSAFTTTLPAADPTTNLSTITGLDNFNGYDLTVWFNNQNLGTYTVANGQIQVLNKANQTGTCTLGMLYENTCEPMYAYAGVEGTDAYKNVTRVFVEYANSLDFSINDQFIPLQSYDDIQNQKPLTPQSDVAIISASDGFARKKSISVTQLSPFDLVILAIRYQLTGGLL